MTMLGGAVTAPQISDAQVAFTLPDPDRALAGVRLAPALSTTAPVDFRFTRSGWALSFLRPPVARMEYRLTLARLDGSHEDVVDPTNPLTTPGAFGAKSVIMFPGYAEPTWLTAPGVPGGRTALSVPARGLGGPVEAMLWSPDGSSADQPMPLLVANDGPEYERMAGLTRYAAALIAAGVLPAFRVALLAPGMRNEWYSAKNAYAHSLVEGVLPAITTIAAVVAPIVAMGSSLGGLAMLHAHRLSRQPSAVSSCNPGHSSTAASIPRSATSPGSPG